MTVRTSVRRCATGAGLVAGAGVVAVAVGMGSAYADTPEGSVEELQSAAADLTQANDVLGKVDIPADDARPHELLGSQIQFQDHALPLLDGQGGAEAIQASLLSSHDSFLSGLGNFLFDGVDQQFAHASEAVFSADQAFAADPSSLTAELGVGSADFQLLGAAFDSLLPDMVALSAPEFDPSAFIEGGHSLEIASLDPAVINDVGSAALGSALDGWASSAIDSMSLF